MRRLARLYVAGVHQDRLLRIGQVQRVLGPELVEPLLVSRYRTFYLANFLRYWHHEKVEHLVGRRELAAYTADELLILFKHDLVKFPRVEVLFVVDGRIRHKQSLVVSALQIRVRLRCALKIELKVVTKLARHLHD